MYTTDVLVKNALIQNVTSTASTVVTISAKAGSAGGSGATATGGILLNPGSAKNQGGGSLPTGNINLGDLYWTATNTNDQISVKYET